MFYLMKIQRDPWSWTRPSVYVFGLSFSMLRFRMCSRLCSYDSCIPLLHACILSASWFGDAVFRFLFLCVSFLSPCSVVYQCLFTPSPSVKFFCLSLPVWVGQSLVSCQFCFACSVISSRHVPTCCPSSWNPVYLYISILKSSVNLCSLLRCRPNVVYSSVICEVPCFLLPVPNA